jgi:tRNA(Ile2) C34 agmatinyltransferase TiaS
MISSLRERERERERENPSPHHYYLWERTSSRLYPAQPHTHSSPSMAETVLFHPRRDPQNRYNIDTNSTSRWNKIDITFFRPTKPTVDPGEMQRLMTPRGLVRASGAVGTENSNKILITLAYKIYTCTSYV